MFRFIRHIKQAHTKDLGKENDGESWPSLNSLAPHASVGRHARSSFSFPSCPLPSHSLACPPTLRMPRHPPNLLILPLNPDGNPSRFSLRATGLGSREGVCEIVESVTCCRDISFTSKFSRSGRIVVILKMGFLQNPSALFFTTICTENVMIPQRADT